ncbi:hypothetical protein FPQ10_10520 [Allobacillus sp. SKP2-8]|uniref:hypothetical protein n=1 Tax=unclassified Allobacillus TaxID=2628859 RepID=UPI0011828015|nr:hypothetical protein [Allobacillus sp. SKP2-8]TSJ65010.1 hypothetical protein FPQ10_10520 [Allobacillus sp. SKP2-8]
MTKRQIHKGSTPRHKRMNRSRRLEAAKYWIPKYEGNNLVSGYSKHFGVDKKCAVNELEILGYPVKSSYKTELKNADHQKKYENKKRKKLKREEQIEEKLLENSNERFAFIAGYTSGGVPFGVTWEEWNKLETTKKYDLEKSEKNKKTVKHNNHYYMDDDELPF